VRLREVTAASEEEQMHSNLTGAPAPPPTFLPTASPYCSITSLSYLRRNGPVRYCSWLTDRCNA